MASWGPQWSQVWTNSVSLGQQHLLHRGLPGPPWPWQTLVRAAPALVLLGLLLQGLALTQGLAPILLTLSTSTSGLSRSPALGTQRHPLEGNQRPKQLVTAPISLQLPQNLCLLSSICALQPHEGEGQRKNHVWPAQILLRFQGIWEIATRHPCSWAVSTLLPIWVGLCPRFHCAQPGGNCSFQGWGRKGQTEA